ncbi:MAG: TRAP transporter substrate-binding protein DctP [Pikeienuella sp.]
MRLLTAAAALFAILSSLPAVAACDPGERAFTFSHTGPERGSARGEAAAMLAERINTELEGRACMTVTHLATDHSEAGLVEAIRARQFDFGAADTGTLGDLSARFLVYELPFLFDGIEAVLHFNGSSTGQQLLGAAAPAGLSGLALWLDGFEQLTADRAIAAPEDAAGLVFAATGSPLEAAYFTVLDGSFVELSRQEVFNALRDGVIQGQNASFSAIFSEGLETVQASATETDHVVSHLVLLTSTQTWEGLDPGLRAELTRIIREVTHERNRLVYELNEAAKFRLMQRGLSIRALSAEERLNWKRAMQPVWFEFGGEIGFDQISAAIYANRVSRR